jgi:hypothetical protein
VAPLDGRSRGQDRGSQHAEAFTIVEETVQSEARQAARPTVVGRPPGPPILDGTELLERAAHHIRLRALGDLEAVAAEADAGSGDLTSEI